MTAKIVQLTPPTPSALIRAKIQRETAVLESRRGLNSTMSPTDALIMFADVLEQNAIYLTDREDPALQPVIESLIKMSAKIRYWLVE